MENSGLNDFIVIFIIPIVSAVIITIISSIIERRKMLHESKLKDLNLSAFTYSLQIGRYLVRKTDDNPFIEYTTKIKIYDIKDGWVKYKYVYDNFSDELNDKVEFSYSEISDLYRLKYKILNN